jgi:hypothetical protein
MTKSSMFQPCLISGGTLNPKLIVSAENVKPEFWWDVKAQSWPVSSVLQRHMRREFHGEMTKHRRYTRCYSHDKAVGPSRTSVAVLAEHQEIVARGQSSFWTSWSYYFLVLPTFLPAAVVGFVVGLGWFDDWRMLRGSRSCFR